MENEFSQPENAPQPKKSKRMKTTTWLMITTIVVLCGYYLALGVYKNRAQKDHRADSLKQAELLAAKQNAPVQLTDTLINTDYLMGKLNPVTNLSFTDAQVPYASRSGMYVREEAYTAFKKMYDAALKDGVRLMIISATRTFDAQKGIWEAKWNGSRSVEGKNLATAVPDPVERARIILKYSSMPGTSRHHWGTDLDLNSMDPAYFNTAAGKKIYDWLVQHAKEYGFGQPYCEKGEKRPSGYEEEKWHWSYLPLSRQYTSAWLTMVKYSDIKGFKGAETAEKLNVIRDYVEGINPDCK
jgi:LAS superfamily LD-carboxypeptidase LdcB